MDMLRNGSESDVDCGAACPTRCAPGQSCGAPGDCASSICDAGVCGSSSCTDLVRNGDESDVDCGGSCSLNCVAGQACGDGGDCSSKYCVNNVCVAELVATSLAATIDCAPSASMVLTADGGMPPYTWSSSAGVVVFDGGPTAQLLATPTASFAGQAALRAMHRDSALSPSFTCTGGHASCNFGWQCSDTSGGFWMLFHYSCEGRIFDYRYPNAPGICAPNSSCTNPMFGASCPVMCDSYMADLRDAGCGPIGEVVDVRTPAMLDGGCAPCETVFSAGAQVTVTDSAGQMASVNLGAPSSSAASSLTFTANQPSIIDAGTRVILSWDTRNLYRCSASGSWGPGNMPVDGTLDMGPVTADAGYTLRCDGPNDLDQSATLNFWVR
jgi:hypothetical protein